MKQLKKFIIALLIAANFFIMSYSAYAEQTVNAVKCSSGIYVNDEATVIRPVMLSENHIIGYVPRVYNINGNNYFQIRDLAEILKDTTACFDVYWNNKEEQTEIITGQAYIGKDDSLEYNFSDEVTAFPTSSKLIIDGEKVDITAYNIRGNNYYMLRDLSKYISFDVSWVEESNSICIYSHSDNSIFTEKSGGNSNLMRVGYTYGETNRSYIYDIDKNNFCVFAVEDNSYYEYDETTNKRFLVYDDTIHIDYYNSDTFKLYKSLNVPTELQSVGGFYAGNEYNYIVFGQENKEEDDSKATFRVVKYSKDWQRLGAVDYCDNGTTIPFKAGNLRMVESNGYLYIRTAHQMYTSNDGLNHQSNLTFCVDTKHMKIPDRFINMFFVEYGYVSHSFNQFIVADEEKIVVLDHGDAYPRSVVLAKYDELSESNDLIEEHSCINLFNISGESGKNYTGVNVNALEISKNNYIVGINTIDQSNFDAKSKRNVVLLISAKNNTNENEVKQISLTDYFGTTKEGSAPYIIKLSDNKFAVLWEEFEDKGGFEAHRNGVKYVEIDENGNKISEIKSFPDVRLSVDCQPVIIDDSIVWYTDLKGGRMFYCIEL